MKKVALLTDGWRRYVTYSWVDGITQYAREIGLDLMLYTFNTNGNLSHDAKYNKGEYSLYDLIDYNSYDGIIFDCTNTKDYSKITHVIEQLRTLDIPVVSISYYVDGLYYVGNDNQKLFRRVVDHLFHNHGCRRLVFAGGPDYNYENMQRYEAFKRAHEEYNIPFSQDMCLFGEFDYDTGVKYMREWCEAGKELPDAFVCANDNIAAGICAEAERRGLSIPDNFRVTGFDNLDKAAYYKPQITTVEHNRGNIGKSALNILNDIWDGKCVSPFTYLESELITGESCGCSNSGRCDYRFYAKSQIDWSVERDRHEENVLELEDRIAESKTFTGLFENFANYIRTLNCKGLIILVDKYLLEARHDKLLSKDGYKLDRSVVAYAEMEGNRLNSLKSTEDVKRFMDISDESDNYIFFPMHFRDEIVGTTILRNPRFLYSNPFFYDVHNAFVNKMENLYRQTQLTNAASEMREIYNRDPLTHLYNRLAYTEMITPKFDRYCKRGVACAMVFFDVDYFKDVNDTFGHEMGDRVLVTIANVIVKNKPLDAYAYRFGGDEFVVFFPYAMQSKTDAFIKKVTTELDSMKISVSHGEIVTNPELNKSLDDYLVMADQKMYEVKSKRHKHDKLMFGLMGNKISMPTFTNTDESKKGHFYKGVDISSLPERIDGGARFYSEDGTEMDAFDLLISEGVDSVRLRIWNDPKQFPESNGYCDLPQTIEMAKKIKSKNLHFMLDFHYSDYWADPGQQRKPVSWIGLNMDQLAQAVYDYTTEVLTELEKVDALPDIVQVGNEIRSGMIFPEGEVPNYANLARLINSGIKAVRDISENIKVMIHLDQGGRFYYLKEWFDNVFAAGMESIDAIGISYYSFWHGTFQDLKDSMNQLIERYDVPVYVVETAHPWRQCEGEHVSEDLMKTAGLPAGIPEQKRSLEMVCQIATECADGRETGVYYWEPLCVTNSGFGSWDQNMGMLDDEQRVLEGFHAFRDFDPEKLPIENISQYIEKLYEIDESMLPPAGSNLVQNGDFSEGLSGWWVQKSSEEVNVEEREGEIYVSAPCNFSLLLFRELRIDKPGTYQMMVDYRGTNTTGVDVKMFLKTIVCNGEQMHSKTIYPSDVRFVTHSLEKLELDAGQIQLGIEMNTPPVFGRIANIRLIEVE